MSHVFLSIDDSRAVHSFITHCFDGKMVELEHAYNGKEGLSKIIENQGKYDLVLLDWEMPVMSGPETLEELSRQGLQVPVIMLTSRNDVSDISSALEKGALDYVMKPFTPEILLEKIEQVINTKLG